MIQHPYGPVQSLGLMATGFQRGADVGKLFPLLLSEARLGDPVVSPAKMLAGTLQTLIGDRLALNQWSDNLPSGGTFFASCGTTTLFRLEGEEGHVVRLRHGFEKAWSESPVGGVMHLTPDGACIHHLFAAGVTSRRLVEHAWAGAREEVRLLLRAGGLLDRAVFCICDPMTFTYRVPNFSAVHVASIGALADPFALAKHAPKVLARRAVGPCPVCGPKSLEPVGVSVQGPSRKGFIRRLLGAKE